MPRMTTFIFIQNISQFLIGFHPPANYYSLPASTDQNLENVSNVRIQWLISVMLTSLILYYVITDVMAQQLSCFGLSADLKKMAKEFMAMQRKIAELLTKAEKNKCNYIQACKNTVYFLMILSSFTVFKEGG